MKTMSMRALPVVCAAGLLLAGCGGGGGDDGSSATPGFTASDYQEVAEPLAVSIRMVGGVVGTLGSELFGGMEQAQATGQAPRPAPVALLQRLAARSTGTQEQALAVEPFSELCPGGGSLGGSFNDNDNDQGISQGDSATVTASQCVIEGQTLNGGFSITVSRYNVQTVPPYAESGQLALSFNNLRAAGASLNGSATLGFSGDDSQASLSLGFNGATFASAGTSLRLGYTTRIAVASDATARLSLDGGLGYNGHDYTLAQIAPFVSGISGLQAGGALEVRESQGARLRVVSGDSRFTYQYFAPANAGNTPSASTPGLAY